MNIKKVYGYYQQYVAPEGKPEVAAYLVIAELLAEIVARLPVPVESPNED